MNYRKHISWNGDQRKFFDSGKKVFLAQHGSEFDEGSATFFETAAGGVIAIAPLQSIPLDELQILGFSETSWDHPAIAPSFFCFKIKSNLDGYDPSNSELELMTTAEKIQIETNLDYETPDLTTKFLDLKSINTGF